MELFELRKQLDEIDTQLARLFVLRMRTVGEIAELKRDRGLALYHPAREREILDRVGTQAGELGAYARELFATLLNLSRSYQTRLLGAKENIALVGMPGCGKSAVGALVAAALGREFVDTDALVEAECGCSIAELFEREGEAEFRRRECAAVARISERDGIVIATGGGAVLSGENRAALRRSARVYLLERETALLAVEGRPLSESRERLEKMLAERGPLYLEVADRVVKNLSAAEAASEIVRDFYENLEAKQ